MTSPGSDSVDGRAFSLGDEIQFDRAALNERGPFARVSASVFTPGFRLWLSIPQ